MTLTPFTPLAPAANGSRVASAACAADRVTVWPL